MVTPTWRATITTAGLVFDRPRDWQLYLNRLGGYGTDVDVTIRQHKAQRSSAQNRYWHGVVIPLIADELGWSREDRPHLHYWLLTVFGGTHHDEKTGLDIPNIQHSRALNTKQFAELVDWVLRYAMTEWGIHLPAPNEVDVDIYEVS